MAKFYSELNEKLRAFIAAQHIFFTGTAAPVGRINVSPKGMNSLLVMDDRTLAYMDLTGSGNETAAHLKHDGRITLMWCSFDADPLILRVYGHGAVVSKHAPEWPAWQARFDNLPGERQLIVIHIDSVQTSCGYAVPEYRFAGDRPTLARWAEKKGVDGVRDYQTERNSVSIDGLPTGIEP